MVKICWEMSSCVLTEIGPIWVGMEGEGFDWMRVCIVKEEGVQKPCGWVAFLRNTDSFLNLSSYAFNRGTGTLYCVYVMELAGGVRKGLLSL